MTSSSSKKKHYVIGDVDRVGNRITFQLIEVNALSTQYTRTYGIPDKTIYGAKRRMRLVFNRPDDCSKFFDILTMGISQIEEEEVLEEDVHE